MPFQLLKNLPHGKVLIECAYCDDKGVHPSLRTIKPKCELCDGRGERIVNSAEVAVLCRRCGGSGKEPTMRSTMPPCEKCDGLGAYGSIVAETMKGQIEAA